MHRIIGGLLIAFALSACSTGGGSGGSGGGGDASAELACTHFRDVARDAANGILTDTELRGKLQEVNNDAQYSEEPGVAPGALRMLRDVTDGDKTDFQQAIVAFSGACTRAGF